MVRHGFHPLARRTAFIVLGAFAGSALGCEDDARRAQPPPSSRPTGENHQPEVKITAPQDGASVTNPVVLTGTAVDREDGPLADHTMSWLSDADGELGTGARIETTLTAGPHLLTFVAKDSVGFMGSDQVRITVTSTVNQSPQAVIDSPRDGAVFVEGDAVVLEGRGVDPEDGDLPPASLFWSSDVDGPLGTGRSVTMPMPSIGTRRILLTVIDSVGGRGLASITVEVAPVGTNRAPVVTITTPNQSDAFVVGDAIAFSGTAEDPEDGPLSGPALSWSSSLDGAFGQDTALVHSGLSFGVHTITLTATDTQGATGSDQIVISVNPPGNTPPTARIRHPADGTTVSTNDTVRFEGSATDAEDGALSGTSLAWWSSVDGSLGTGQTVNVRGLSPGTHGITLIATDSGGATGTAAILIAVLTANTAPVVSITGPADGSTFTAGDAVTFSGTAMDAEDGPLSGSSIVWQSSVDGRMGTGSPLGFSSLSVATHVVTLTAIDSGGLPASASIQVTIMPAPVNLAPVANLIGPAQGLVGETLTYDASGSRDSDGSIVEYRFDFGDGTGPVSGTSATATHVYAAPGTFAVTLAVTDDDGATGSDTMTTQTEIPIPVPEVIIDTSDEYGSRCELTLDGADRPHIVYRNETHLQLWYAWYDGAAWNTALIDGPGFDIGGLMDDVYALAASGAGVPHIAYRNRTDGNIWYATRAGNVWTREMVSATTIRNLDTPVAIRLDPANGDRPTVAWTRGRDSSPYDEEPVVAFRTGTNTWTEDQYTSAGNDDNFLGGMAFDASGALWMAYDPSYLKVMQWTPSGSFQSSESVGASASYPTALVLDTALQPIVITRTHTHHRVGGSWVSTAFHSTSTSYFAAATRGSHFVVALRHGSDIEIARPGPFWTYDYQGPMDAAHIGLAVDAAGRARACFFRSGNVMVY